MMLPKQLKVHTVLFIALPSEEDRAMATGNMYKQFREMWMCGFWDMRADRQTNIQTYIHTDHNTSHPCWGKV